MRSLVSYDDIALQAPDYKQASTDDSGSPPKKRRKNNRSGQRHRGDDNEYKHFSKKRRDYGFKEESRHLTHEEIWDDSALIRAWDAAVEEYEVLNGPDKKWKTDPVNKSALWFNIPPESEETSEPPRPSLSVPSVPVASANQSEGMDEDPTLIDPENSRPVNFNTFVPCHDPALSQVDTTMEREQLRGSDVKATSSHTNVLPPIPDVLGSVSKDEAFQRAIGSWYWAGYWTGVYHSINGSALTDTTNKDEEGEGNKNTRVLMGDVEDEQGEDLIVDESSSDEASAEEKDLIPT